MKRKLKVTESYRNKKFVPQVNLCGKWLAQAGFHTGSQIEIIIENGQILIQKGGLQ